MTHYMITRESNLPGSEVLSNKFVVHRWGDDGFSKHTFYTYQEADDFTTEDKLKEQ